MPIYSGLGREMWQVILGRAISGIGGAGTMTVAAVIITGMFEMHMFLPSRLH